MSGGHDTVIVGGGQSGLAIGRLLANHGHDFTILETSGAPAAVRGVLGCASAASEESADGGHHLFGPLVLLAGFRADHAGVSVAVE